MKNAYYNSFLFKHNVNKTDLNWITGGKHLSPHFSAPLLPNIWCHVFLFKIQLSFTNLLTQKQSNNSDKKFKKASFRNAWIFQWLLFFDISNSITLMDLKLTAITKNEITWDYDRTVFGYFIIKNDIIYQNTIRYKYR